MIIQPSVMIYNDNIRYFPSSKNQWINLPYNINVDNKFNEHDVFL